MPRFVVLEHDFPELHWDLMLECGAALGTWRLAQAPEPGTEVIAATPLGDHRLHYLDYEGPVSGNRGSVRRFDAGEYEGEVTEGGWQIRMFGKKIRALASLEHGEDGVRIRFTPVADAPGSPSK